MRRSQPYPGRPGSPTSGLRQPLALRLHPVVRFSDPCQLPFNNENIYACFLRLGEKNRRSGEDQQADDSADNGADNEFVRNRHRGFELVHLFDIEIHDCLDNGSYVKHGMRRIASLI